MSILKHPVLQIVVFLILGILFGFYFNLSISVLIISVVLSFSFLLIVFLTDKKKLKTDYSFLVITYILFFFIGCSSVTFKNDFNKKNHYTKFYNNSSQNLLVLTITSVLKSSNYYNKYLAEVHQINNQKTQGKILLNISKDSTVKKLNIDDKILTNASFKDLNKAKNPYQFDYKSYLKKQQVYRQVSIPSNHYKLLISNTNTLKGLAYKSREYISKSLLNQGFKNDELSIINALLLGKRQDVSKDIIENYTKAGAIHILAISGLHIGIILLFLNFVLKPIEYFKNGKNLKLVLCVLLLWCFAFLAGLSSSVVRAVTMFTALAISYMGNRKTNVYQNLIISIFFLLLFNPYYLFDVGFQLSYLAVFFIVWVRPMLDKLWTPKFKPLNYLWQLFTVSICAQIGVLPLSLYYFHQFPALFFVTNLVVLPFLGLILTMGIIIILLSLLNILPKFLATFYEIIIAKMNAFISWIAKQESFLFENIYFSILLMFTSYIFIITFFRWVQAKSFKNLRIALVSLIALQSVFIYEKWKLTNIHETIIFNKTKQTIVGSMVKNNLTLNTSDSVFKNESFLSAYSSKTDVTNLTIKHQIPPTLLLNENVLIIDSLGVYNLPKLHPDKILLIHSPKINLERMIDVLKPKEIIADNSNYKSYKNRWKNTCKSYNIPFYDTNENGAYIIKK